MQASSELLDLQIRQGDNNLADTTLTAPDSHPTPEQAAGLSLSALRSTLKRAGLQRNLDRRAAETQANLRRPQLAAPAVLARHVRNRRLVGILHDCLAHHTINDEHTARGHRDHKIPTAA